MAITNAELKKLVTYGAARDITNEKIPDSLRRGMHRVLVVKGTYGVHGALYVSKSGKLYAVIGRSSNIGYLPSS